MKKINKNQIEKIKTATIVILLIVVFFGVVYLISENTGDRSNDKNPNNIQSSTNEEERNPLLVEGEELKEEEQKSLVSMSYDDFKKSLDKEERKFVFLGSEYCGWCTYQKPILEHVMYKYPVEINYLNVGTMTNEQYGELAGMHSDLENFGTPTFLVIEKGKVTGVYGGARGIEAIVSLLKNNGFINE